jgi:hypothetical protein
MLLKGVPVTKQKPFYNTTSGSFSWIFFIMPVERDLSTHIFLNNNGGIDSHHAEGIIQNDVD